jgi:hypothetical protein
MTGIVDFGFESDKAATQQVNPNQNMSQMPQPMAIARSRGLSKHRNFAFRKI